MNNYFTTFKINDHIYQVKEKMGVLVTIIIGHNKAMLIDTGYGIYNLREYIYHNITKLPLIVVASHGHMDHTGGNYLFDEVYINELDINLCIKHSGFDRRKRSLEGALSLGLIDNDYDKNNYINRNEGNLIKLSNNHVFDLGGISIKVIPMEGHTKGSIGLYISEDKYLVVTDATCPFVWLFLDESEPVSTYIEMLERTLQLDFSHILLGHGKGCLIERNRVLEFLEVAKTIDLKKAVKVAFNNFEDANSYCYTTGVMYNQDHAGIVFDPNKM